MASDAWMWNKKCSCQDILLENKIIPQLVGVSRVCNQRGDRVSKNNKSYHICSTRLKRFIENMGLCLFIFIFLCIILFIILDLDCWGSTNKLKRISWIASRQCLLRLGLFQKSDYEEPSGDIYRQSSDKTLFKLQVNSFSFK